MEKASEVRIYNATLSVVFLKTKDPFGGLSNMAPHFPLRVSGVHIRTSEALYQACRFPHLPEVQLQIIDARSPMTAKMLSKRFRKDSRSDWDAVRVKAMRWSLRVKLAQNWREFGGLLRATGDCPIVEQSMKDDYWGAKYIEDGNLVGMNVLGRLLMELREQLKSDRWEGLKNVVALSIPNFLLFGKPIDPIFTSDGVNCPGRPVVSDTRQAPFIGVLNRPDPLQPHFVDRPVSAEGQVKPQDARIARNLRKNMLKPYSFYRESGLLWLGRVPKHWEVKTLKQIGRFSKGKGGSKEDEGPSGVPCVRYGDLYTTHTHFINDSRSCIPAAKAKDYTPIRFGDVLFAASGETIEEIGKSAVNLIQSEAYCGGDVILFRPNHRVQERYMGYATNCRSAVIQKATMSRGITVMHIYGHQLKSLTLALPPLPEQTAIARFLDHTDRRIRRYIRAKEKLIALLEEQKRALIHEAVTGQIDVRTSESYRAYRESGVEWLGEVPAHWKVGRSKRAFSPRKELAYPDDIQLSATQAYGVIAQREYEERIGRKVVRIVQHLEKRRHVEIDDFVISMRSFQGGLERAWVSGCIRSSYVVLRPAAKVDVGYFSYLFKSASYIKALQSTADFIRDGQDLNYQNFCGIDLPFPSFKEQRRISEVLDDATTEITTAVEKADRQIELLLEYRNRLIADIVTGKLDVREAAAALPEIDHLAAADDLDIDKPMFENEGESAEVEDRRAAAP